MRCGRYSNLGPGGSRWTRSPTNASSKGVKTVKTWAVSHESAVGHQDDLVERLGGVVGALRAL